MVLLVHCSNAVLLFRLFLLRGSVGIRRLEIAQCFFFRFCGRFTWFEEQKRKTNRIPTTGDDDATNAIHSLSSQTHGAHLVSGGRRRRRRRLFHMRWNSCFLLCVSKDHKTPAIAAAVPGSYPVSHHRCNTSARPTTYDKEGELISWLCMSSTAPFYTPSARLSFTISRSSSSM